MEKIIRTFYALRHRLFVKLLALVIIIFIPIVLVGYFYIDKLENILSENQQAVLFEKGRGIAESLVNKQFLLNFSENITYWVDKSNLNRNWQIVPPSRITGEVHLDGRLNEWRGLLKKNNRVDKPFYFFIRDDNAVNGAELKDVYKTLGFTHILAEDAENLYAVFDIKDDRFVRQNKNIPVYLTDHLEINLLDRNGAFKEYVVFVQNGQAKVLALVDYDYQETDDIKAFWLNIPGKYKIELALSKDRFGDDIGEHINFVWVDIDDEQTRNLETLIATTNIGQVQQLSLNDRVSKANRIVQASSINQSETNTRFWVVDNRCQLRGYYGAAYQNLALQKEIFNDVCDHYPLITQTLTQGKESQFSYFSNELNLDIAASALPIIDTQKQSILGAVVIETSLQQVQEEVNTTALTLSGSFIGIFMLSFFVFFAFTARLTERIGILTKETLGAVDEHGIVKKTELEGMQWRDELGDLAQNISVKLKTLQGSMDKLAEYNDYLMQYKDKLRHELQTPLSVARTSLELLKMTGSLSEQERLYIMRADNGLDRLHTILKALSESKNIEQAITIEEKEWLNLGQLLNEHISVFRDLHPEQGITLSLPEKDVFILGSAWLIEQMLDKILNNAVEFAKKDTDIKVSLRFLNDESCQILIANQGVKLTEQMQQQVFDFMISVRAGSDAKSGDVHLGLGLYIARLIAKFHNGEIEALNQNHPQGVMIGIVFNGIKRA